MGLRRISLDDLPRFSRWPARLLGVEQFPHQLRTTAKVQREYNVAKWGTVLAWLKRHRAATGDDLVRAQGIDLRRPTAFSEGDRLLLAPMRTVLARYRRLVMETMRRYRPQVLVELGSGLGEKLLELERRLRPRSAYGGEFTRSGVECGRLLATRSGSAARFEHFNYYRPETLRSVPEGAVVFTSHSIEQIPRLPEAFVSGLIRRAPRVVVHFEPCYEDQDETTLMGLMRRRYAEQNDYNRNLLGVLTAFQKARRIRITQHRPNVFGIQPFNCTSIISWSPRDRENDG